MRTTPTFGVLGRDVLLTGRYNRWSRFANYHVHPDGKRFVMVKGEVTGTALTVVVNWFEELKERMGR